MVYPRGHDRWRLLVCALLSASTTAARGQAPAAPDTALHAVAYVETAASAAREAAAALRAYREATLKQDGCAAVDTFEQIGRPGHWVIIETWRDQKAFDARDPAVQQRLLEAIKRTHERVRPAARTRRRGRARPTAGDAAVSVIAHVESRPTRRSRPC